MSKNTVFKVLCVFLLATLNDVSSGTVMPAESSPSQETKLDAAATNNLHRQARTFGSIGGYNYNRPYEQQRPYDRQPPYERRCISCLYQTMGGGAGPGYLDRDRFYYDNYYNFRPSQHGGGQQREYADRNWYYQPDDRSRYGDRYTPNRHEDRYPNQSPGSGGYERSGNEHQQSDYRGNGYDNRDLAYFNAMRGGGSTGYGGGNAAHGVGNAYGGTAAYGGGNAYDAYDDRLSNRGYSGSTGGSGYHSSKPNPDYYGSGGGSSGGYYNNRDRYAGHSYDRHSEDRYYADRNQGYRGGGYDDRNFQPYDQTFRSIYHRRN